MEASYWARWACNGQVSDLPDLVLPPVLAEGYDLLTADADRHAFDRGGVMKKIAWSLNGGPWAGAPIDLTITYACSPTQTIANFYWKLSVRPFPTTPKEQAGFETHLQQQMNRIIANLNDHLALLPVEEGQEAAEEGAALQACWESRNEETQDVCFAPFAGIDDIAADQAVCTLSTVAEQTKVHRSKALVESLPHCEHCHEPAVPIPGINGRYFCLICRHHLPCKPAAW